MNEARAKDQIKDVSVRPLVKAFERLMAVPNRPSQAHKRDFKNPGLFRNRHTRPKTGKDLFQKIIMHVAFAIWCKLQLGS